MREELGSNNDLFFPTLFHDYYSRHHFDLQKLILLNANILKALFIWFRNLTDIGLPYVCKRHRGLCAYRYELVEWEILEIKDFSIKERNENHIFCPDSGEEMLSSWVIFVQSVFLQTFQHRILLQTFLILDVWEVMLVCFDF